MGLSEQDAIDALHPLIQGNIDNIWNNGILNSLTGPVLRGDVNTINKHLQAIKEDHSDIYKNLSMNLLKLVGKRNLEFSKKNMKNEEEEKILNTENVLNKLIKKSKKHRDIYELLGGLE